MVTSKVPATKRSMERFLFHVKALLHSTPSDCTFWMGELICIHPINFSSLLLQVRTLDFYAELLIFHNRLFTGYFRCLFDHFNCCRKSEAQGSLRSGSEFSSLPQWRRWNGPKRTKSNGGWRWGEQRQWNRGSQGGWTCWWARRQWELTSIIHDTNLNVLVKHSNQIQLCVVKSLISDKRSFCIKYKGKKK